MALDKSENLLNTVEGNSWAISFRESKWMPSSSNSSGVGRLFRQDRFYPHPFQMGDKIKILWEPRSTVNPSQGGASLEYDLFWPGLAVQIIQQQQLKLFRSSNVFFPVHGFDFALLERYPYLGYCLQNRLDWKSNTIIYKKVYLRQWILWDLECRITQISENGDALRILRVSRFRMGLEIPDPVDLSMVMWGDGDAQQIMRFFSYCAKLHNLTDPMP